MLENILASGLQYNAIVSSRASCVYTIAMEEKESGATLDADTQEAQQATRWRQARRLVRLATDFDTVVADLPNGQRYIEEHRAVVRSLRNSDHLNLHGRY